MKRNKKLIEELLFEIETIDSAKNSKDIKIKGYVSKEIEEHLLYMYEQNLFNGIKSHSKHNTENRVQYNWLLIRLTKEGHDLLEKEILEKELELLNEALKDSYGLALLEPPDKILSIGGQKSFTGKIYLRAFRILELEYLIEHKKGQRYEITGEGIKFLKEHTKPGNNSTNNNKENPHASVKKSGITKNQIFETTFNTYTALKLISKGGSGKVYKVQNKDSNIYALKCLKKFDVSSENKKRFSSESSFLQRNSHPNIITALDSGFIIIKNIKHPFYVMKYYDKTLRDLINKGINAKKILPLFLMILNGIEEAHKNGIFHRDLKPENILFDSDSENLAIADFGIAHFTQKFLLTAIETRPNQKLANFQYAAPEQRERGQTVDFRADIFSLGLILNEMFTKKIPQGTNYKTIGSINPDFIDLDHLVKKMIDQDPLNRPEKIEEIKLEINLRFKIS